jgi:hypothetical protein
MNARFRLLLVLPAVLLLGACMSPSGPSGPPTGDDETDKNGDKDGTAFRTEAPAPVVFA